MRRFMLFALLLVGTVWCVLFVSHRRTMSSRGGDQQEAVASADSAVSVTEVERKQTVDVDFTAFNETVRAVKCFELMMDPTPIKDKTVRLEGWAYDRVDRDGTPHAWLRVYDRGACCPLLTVEYLLAGTNTPPREGSLIVLEGTCILRAPPVFPIIIVSNAMFRVQKQSKILD